MWTHTSAHSATAFLLCLCLALPAAAQISQKGLKQLFDEARLRNTDLSTPHLWGFYFTSPTRTRLDNAATQLVADGYRLVAVERVEPDMWQLHVERVGAYTVDSLYAVTIELEALAEAHEIEKVHTMDIDAAPME